MRRFSIAYTGSFAVLMNKYVRRIRRFCQISCNEAINTVLMLGLQVFNYIYQEQGDPGVCELIVRLEKFKANDSSKHCWGYDYFRPQLSPTG